MFNRTDSIATEFQLTHHTPPLSQQTGAFSAQGWKKKNQKKRSNLRSNCHTCRPLRQKQTVAAVAVYSHPPLCSCNCTLATSRPPYRRHPRWLQMLFTERREIRGLPNTLRTMWPAAARSSSNESQTVPLARLSAILPLVVSAAVAQSKCLQVLR